MSGGTKGAAAASSGAAVPVASVVAVAAVAAAALAAVAAVAAVAAASSARIRARSVASVASASSRPVAVGSGPVGGSGRVQQREGSRRRCRGTGELGKLGEDRAPGVFRKLGEHGGP